MPKGTGRPYNRGEREVVAGMKRLRKSGLGRRRNEFPGAEGTPGGVGTFSPYPTDKQYDRGARRAKGGAIKQGIKSKAKGGKVSEYGGKENYKSKSSMMKHESMESPAMEKKEKKMKSGGMMKMRGAGAATKGTKFSSNG